jgi:heme/copper-type cytochrome/quinol oxidase subunit 1
VNDSRFKAEREGIYYGQCTKLCGKDHSAMPITIRVVGEDMPRRYIDYPEAYAFWNRVSSYGTYLSGVGALFLYLRYDAFAKICQEKACRKQPMGRWRDNP